MVIRSTLSPIMCGPSWARFGALQADHPGVGAQPAAELAGAGVDGVDAGGPGVEQGLGEAAQSGRVWQRAWQALLGLGLAEQDRAAKEDRGRSYAGTGRGSGRREGTLRVGARRARARKKGRSRWRRPGGARGTSANANAWSSCYRRVLYGQRRHRERRDQVSNAERVVAVPDVGGWFGAP
jgi:hypothetical protein